MRFVLSIEIVMTIAGFYLPGGKGTDFEFGASRPIRSLGAGGRHEGCG
jgi:hypothetical protein